jgi:hypothetical protein
MLQVNMKQEQEQLSNTVKKKVKEKLEESHDTFQDIYHHSLNKLED